jgi:hypothetical protein
MTTFALIGDGAIAERHRDAITYHGGDLSYVFDPVVHPSSTLSDLLGMRPDFVVVCSPSDQHYRHVRAALGCGARVICEKPLRLPWDPHVDSHLVNVVLQFRWATELPERAEVVQCDMVRNAAYFSTWKGDPKRTGGVFYNLFIHYIDLAMRLGAEFQGSIHLDGDNVRRVDDFDLFSLDQNILYRRMYDDIVNHGRGVKPDELFQLDWVVEGASRRYGYGLRTLGQDIKLDFALV